MISIEPVMYFDLDILLDWMRSLLADFISVGADSGHGHNNLPEPSPTKLKQLLDQLELITEVRKKDNLSRLLEDREVKCQ